MLKVCEDLICPFKKTVRSRPYREGDLKYASFSKREKAAGGIPSSFPAFVIDKVDKITRCYFPADPGVPAEQLGHAVVLNIVHEAKIRGEIKIDFQLKNVLIKCSLWKISPH